VLFLIANLVEHLLTSENRACKWTFISMHSQMIKEVMPFAEIFSTELMIASEDTGNAACLWICELYLAESSGVRYVDLPFEGREINGFSWRSLNLVVVTDLKTLP
jgi:hypothetical protein